MDTDSNPISSVVPDQITNASSDWGEDMEITGVIGAAAWPALSEITKASPKSTSSNSLKNLLEGSQMQVTGGGGNSMDTTIDGFPQAPPPFPKGVMVDSGKVYPSGESSSTHREREGGQKGNFMNNQQRNSFRRGNNGPHPHGNGGGRRDHDRGNQNWSHQNVYIPSLQPQVQIQTQRGPTRPPFFVHGSLPHVNTVLGPHNLTPSWPPYTTQWMYPAAESQLYYVDPYRVIPVVPQYNPYADQDLLKNIVKQTNYYFSDENLIKDLHLRKAMNDQGWVPIKFIAEFNLLSKMTNDIQVIQYALQFSEKVEVEGDKIRRRNDWNKWLLPSPLIQYSAVPPNMFSAQPQGFIGQAQ